MIFRNSDNVLVTGINISVGTIIKRAAYNLHEKKQAMSCQERKIMTSGLSSILDLSDDSFDSQRSLFTQKHWDELHARYDPKFETSLYVLDSGVANYLKIACATLELFNDYDCVLKFLRKLQEQLTNMPCIALKIAEHILGLTKSYQYLLAEIPTKKVTELDYFCTIWSPIFLLLFLPIQRDSCQNRRIHQYLLTMQRDITKLGNSVVSSSSSESCNSFNREYKKNELNPRLHYTRDTYYTPQEVLLQNCHTITMAPLPLLS